MSKLGTSLVARSPAPGLRRLIPAAVVLIAAFGFLGFRVWQSTHRSTTDALLRLGDDVELSAPPPLPADDSASLRARLEPLQASMSMLHSPATQPQDLLDVARQAGLAGDLLLARACLKAAARSGNQRPNVLDARGRLAVQLGLFNEAMQMYAQYRKARPQDAQGFIGANRALAGLGRNREAADTLIEALRTVPATDGRGRAALSAEFLDRGDLPHALEAVQPVLSNDQQNKEASLLAARALYNMLRFQEAQVALERIVTSQPDDVATHVLMGRLLANPLNPKRDTRRAEHLLLTAAQRAPKETEPLLRLGELYREQDRNRQAAYVYTLALALAPDSSVARMQLAAAYQRLGDLARASEQREIARRLVERDRREEELRIARNRRPADAEPRLALAHVYLENGQFGSALAEAQAACAVSNSAPAARETLSTIYRRIGLQAPALEELR